MEYKDEGEKAEPINKEASYLITGGFGGVGMVVANWLVSKGATSLILTARSQPQKEVKEKIDQLVHQGTK